MNAKVFDEVHDSGGGAATPRSFRRNLALLSVAVFVFHFAIGAWYATHSENLPHRVSIWTSGEDFLAMYAGWNTSHERDDAFYNRNAVQILRTGVPRDRNGTLCFYTPVYSYFMAACYAAGGVRFLPLVLGHAVISALTCWLIGSAARRLGEGSIIAGVLAALLYAINLRISMYVGMVSPTILLLFFTALALWAVERTPSRAGGWLFVAAIVLGTYTQSAFFVVSAAAGVWLIARAVRRRESAPALGGVLILLFVALKVWTAAEVTRNTELGKGEHDLLWEDNNPYYGSMTLWSAWERRPGNPWTTWKPSAEEKWQFNDCLARAEKLGVGPGALWIRETPMAYAKVCLVRLRTTLGPTTGQMSSRNRALSTFFWLLVFPAGFYGLWRLRHRYSARLTAWLILAIVAFSALIITEWYLRYRLPMDLLLTGFAGPGYVAMRDYWRVRPE